MSCRLSTLSALSLSALILLPTTLSANPVRNAELSARLYEAAVDLKDPMLAIAAARLRKSVLARRVDVEPVKDGPAPSDPTYDRLMSWQDMLDTARELAPGDEVIAKLAEDVKFAGTKGVTSGEVYSITTIRAGGTDSYPPMTYTGGEYADVYIEGAKSSADLNVFVRDKQGRLVCSDTDISAIAYCGWRPGATEGYTVEVKNKSGIATSYSLITN
ncbi:hypothetical protein [Pseudooceanicola atlanticus]|uniref:Uncharacterized protein n=1 Tax=Pseudooceanicola atlanticus TaxID=1461694 RepID=A0A0A0EDH2_9RHOB|nr:hypothetical protein [Pseudooceanicola atlanticus]KGM49021.1 hypothetical protein ATO9_10035 [Pseudooceanicola atlanticus]